MRGAPSNEPARGRAWWNREATKSLEPENGRSCALLPLPGARPWRPPRADREHGLEQPPLGDRPCLIRQDRFVDFPGWIWLHLANQGHTPSFIQSHKSQGSSPWRQGQQALQPGSATTKAATPRISRCHLS